ncbi:MAG: Mobile element protein [uncultured Gemmatimonadetes bacterium]|uniref:Mobile element protein n=1 Tax=uncultured Gemmatimonadota bacterium TaxID=203437 RepID=A0A6J4KX17_9BACT|nr:MAG: Mobile element protein [uncultured Gemmatimonadota bacterium]
MRRHEQLSLAQPWIAHSHARELEAISRILDAEGGIAERVGQELVRGVKNPETGRGGMSGDQVLRVLVVKQMNGFGYEALHFHLLDSASYRTFCRFGALESVPSRSALAENVKKVRADTLEEINRVLLKRAAREGVEKGRKVRIDSTVVESNIHEPSDSTLLWDSVRVLTRLMEQAGARFTAWRDHTKRAKRRMLAIQRAKTKEKRVRLYRDLLKVSGKVLGYAQAARDALTDSAQEKLRRLAFELNRHRLLLERVVDQTQRRVLRGESVPAAEKVVSIFEAHTDVIVKDGRDTFYGHKVFLTGGASGLVLDCVIRDGNPADSTLSTPMLQRQKEIYGRPPRQAAMDGGFASKQNLAEAKELGVADVCFAKKRGLKVPDMVKSTWVYRKLRDFRAGIEGMISFLKRAFGLDRCTWRGELSFQSYVWSGVLAANLLTLARHTLA